MAAGAFTGRPGTQSFLELKKCAGIRSDGKSIGGRPFTEVVNAQWVIVEDELIKEKFVELKVFSCFVNEPNVLFPRTFCHSLKGCEGGLNITVVHLSPCKSIEWLEHFSLEVWETMPVALRDYESWSLSGMEDIGTEFLGSSV